MAMASAFLIQVILADTHRVSATHIRVITLLSTRATLSEIKHRSSIVNYWLCHGAMGSDILIYFTLAILL